MMNEKISWGCNLDWGKDRQHWSKPGLSNTNRGNKTTCWWWSVLAETRQVSQGQPRPCHAPCAPQRSGDGPIQVFLTLGNITSPPPSRQRSRFAFNLWITYNWIKIYPDCTQHKHHYQHTGVSLPSLIQYHPPSTTIHHFTGRRSNQN